MNKLNQMSNDLAEVKRGMYGDPKNGLVGLIESDKKQEVRIIELELEEKKKKHAWKVGLVALGFIQGVIEFSKWIFRGE
jgi:hypothetical protein